MSWYRGTEAPMDTSPAGPPQKTIFDMESERSWGAQPSASGSQTNASLYRAVLASQDTLADVEMTSLTPPSQKKLDADAIDKLDESSGSLIRYDDGSEKRRADRHAVVSSRAQRKRSVLSKRGKRLAQLQSRDTRRQRRNIGSDGDADPTDGNGSRSPYDQEDDEDDDGSDLDDTPSRIRSMTSFAVNYMLPGVSSTATAASSTNPLDRPELLLGYAQLVFNASILGAFLYMLYHVVRTVQRDVAEKVRAYEMDTLSEITACASAYTANRCGTELQAPALMAACKNWERCSARDPAVVGTARVTAETFAEILNGFVDSVSWKTMLFTLLSLSIVVGATNSTLSFFRIKSRSIKDSSLSSGQSSSAASAYHMPSQTYPLMASGPPPLHLPYGQHYAGQAYPTWQMTTPSGKQRLRNKDKIIDR